MFSLESSTKGFRILKTFRLWLLVSYFARNANAIRDDQYLLPKCCNTNMTAIGDQAYGRLCDSRKAEIVNLPGQLFTKISDLEEIFSKIDLYSEESSFYNFQIPPSPKNKTEPVQVTLNTIHSEALECECKEKYEDFTVEFNDVKFENHELFSDEGLLVHNGYIFDQSQFCIQSVLDNAVSVRTCKEECSTDKPCINRCYSAEDWSPNFYDSVEDIHPTPRSDGGVQPFIRKRRPGLSVCNFYNSTINGTEISFKLMRNGDLMQAFLTDTWNKVDLKEYCIDPFVRLGNSGEPEFSGNPEDFVVMWCLGDTGFLENELTIDIPYNIVALTGIIFIDLWFIMAIAVVYIMRKDKEPVFRWSIVAYSISLIIAYCILTFDFTYSLMQIRSLVNQYEITINTLALLRIMACYLYFYGFSWISVLCFDVWLTLTYLSPEKKSYKRLRWYFAFTSTIPAAIIGAGIVNDVVYHELQISEVIKSRGVFSKLLSWSLVIFNSINFLLFVATAVKLWVAQRSSEIRRAQRKT